MNKDILIRVGVPSVALVLVVGVIIAAASMASASGEVGVDSSYFARLVVSGGPIVWFVLLPMSVLMVYLAVHAAVRTRRTRLLPETWGRNIADIIRRGGGMQVESQVRDRDDLVSKSISNSLDRSGGDFQRMGRLLSESLDDESARLFRRVDWLSLVGNVAPMIGLFGTVFGMIQLFNSIVVTGGQPQPVHLAGGISTALVTTLWGLMVAIPALAVHGVLTSRLEAVVNDAALELELIESSIIAASQTTAPAPVRTAPTRQSIQELPPKPAARTKVPRPAGGRG